MSLGKVILVIFTFTLSGLTHSQIHHFLYRMQYKLDSTDSKSFSIETVLETSQKSASFFDHRMYQADSINKRNGTRMATTPGFDYQVSRQIGQWKNENHVFVSGKNFVYPSVDYIHWKLQDEVKTIGPLSVQKATTKFGGRTWTAWFTPEIPISEGPYKFQGLPGLIIEIYDDKENYHFLMVKNHKINNRQEVWIPNDVFGLKAIPIMFKKYQELRINEYNNPYADLRAQMLAGVDVELATFGRKIKTPKQLDEIIRLQKERVRHHYNPIELDKAVNYK